MGKYVFTVFEGYERRREVKNTTVLRSKPTFDQAVNADDVKISKQLIGMFRYFIVPPQTEVF